MTVWIRPTSKHAEFNQNNTTWPAKANQIDAKKMNVSAASLAPDSSVHKATPSDITERTARSGAVVETIFLSRPRHAQCTRCGACSIAVMCVSFHALQGGNFYSDAYNYTVITSIIIHTSLKVQMKWGKGATWYRIWNPKQQGCTISMLCCASSQFASVFTGTGLLFVRYSFKELKHLNLHFNGLQHCS